MKSRDIIQLIRLPNLLMVGILLYVMNYQVAVSLLQQSLIGSILPWWAWTLLTLATVCIAAAGYVINDYFDIKIDRINRPDRVLVTTSISKDEAMHTFYALTIAGVAMGLAFCVWAHSWTLTTIFIVIPGLLWFYSASYKRQLIIGNLVVAFASGLTPLLIAIATVDRLQFTFGAALHFTPITAQLYSWLGAFALFAFLLTFAREVVKDMEDQEGDREMECHTIPVVLGPLASKCIVTCLLFVVMAMIGVLWAVVLPYERAWSSWTTRYIFCTLLIPLLGDIILVWAAKIPQDFHRAQGLLKWVMFMGVLFGFFV